MTLREFMFAADALRIEEGLSFHVETAPGRTVAAVPSPADVKERNAQAMAALAPILAMTKKKRPRR